MEIYKSFDEFKKEFYPREYKKEQQDRRIKEIGLGRYLAEQFLDSMRKIIKKN